MTTTPNPNQTHIFRETSPGQWDEAQIITLCETVVPIGEELALDNGEIILGMSSGPSNPSTRCCLSSLDFFGPSSDENETWSRREVTPRWTEPLSDAERDLLRSDPLLLAEFRAFQQSRDPADRLARYVDADNGYAIASFGNVQGRSAALLYEKTEFGEWKELRAFTDPSGSPSNSFGSTGVAIKGTTAAVANATLGPEGSVYVYERGDGDWGQVAELDLNADLGRDFGRANLALSEDTLLARDWLSSGEVLMYELDENGDWGFSTSLADIAVADGLDLEFAMLGRGLSMAIEGDVLAVSANGFLSRPPVDPTPVEQRRVNVYRRDEARDWVLQQVLLDPEPEAGRLFGSSLAIDGGRLLIGSESSFDPVTDSYVGEGRAYLYTLIPEPGTAWLLLSCIALAGRLRSGSQRFA